MLATTTGRGDSPWKKSKSLPHNDQTFYSYYVLLCLFPRSDNVWFAWVNLPPGTHHIRYIVDDQVRISDDLPTAVDDQGSLANYVAIPYSPHASPNSYGAQHAPTAQRHNSFWSEASSSAAFPEKWTNKLPPELLAAAREEEVYLASLSNSLHTQPAPLIPPAPVLPRHLDKLILNTRVATDRDTHRERRRKTTKSRPPVLQSGSDSGTHSPTNSSQEAIIPVTTASGTDVSATAKQTHPHAMRPTTLKFSNSAGSTLSKKLDAARLTDDASVLPVPNHVVLHHLSTSAIKNGVLAVADTVRYKKKVCQYISSLPLRLGLTPHRLRTVVHHHDLLQTYVMIYLRGAAEEQRQACPFVPVQSR